VTVTLERRLTTLSATLFGLSYICPTVVVSTFGLIAQTTHGVSAASYLAATFAIVLTATSYGQMARRYPQAGSAYTYVSRTTNSTVGFIIGWVLMLDYFFIPMVVCLFTAKAMEVLIPTVSYRPWIVLVAAFTTGANILGIKVADRVNLVIMAAQLTAMGVLVLTCAHYLLTSGQGTPLFSTLPFVNSQTTLWTVMAGASVASYSFLGFDAVTTLSEETLDPTRTIPRATLLSPAIAGLLFAASSYLFTQVHPSLTFKDLDNAGFEILQVAGGREFLVPFTCVLVASYVAAALVAQAGSSRLLYAMGRDGALSQRWFGYLQPRWRTPVVGILLMGLVMLAGEWIDVETAAACVNFGAFSAFFAVNACVLLDYFGPRQLGEGVGKVWTACGGALGSLWLLISLERSAHVVGIVWLVGGLVYTLWRTRAFRVPMTSLR
jgi:putrescine importer